MKCAHKEEREREREKLKQSKHKASSTQAKRLEFFYKDTQSQLQSQNNKIGEVIATVNDSLTASNDPSIGNILNMVPTRYGNGDASALANPIIANLHTQTQKQTNNLNHAYQVQCNASCKYGRSGGFK